MMQYEETLSYHCISLIFFSLYNVHFLPPFKAVNGEGGREVSRVSRGYKPMSGDVRDFVMCTTRCRKGCVTGGCACVVSGVCCGALRGKETGMERKLPDSHSFVYV